MTAVTSRAAISSITDKFADNPLNGPPSNLLGSLGEFGK